MGRHAKEVCEKQNATCKGDLIYVSWFAKDDGSKGAFLCAKHDRQEVSNYIQEK
jgi:hypothetical protein